MVSVAFISRSTLFSSPGGDTRQLEETARCLREKGVKVDVFLSSQNISYDKYDLLHFFNIIRPADILVHIYRSRKPYVVSTIFVEYGKVKEEGKLGFASMIKNIFSESTLEYLKVIARAAKNGEKIVSKRYLLMGHSKAIKYIARSASCLLPNSESEYKRFQKKYQVTNRYVIVPNGIDERLIKNSYPVSEKYKNAILCMGRIESRKNQLALIHALNNTDYNVFIHGKPSPNNKAYYLKCLQAAASNIHILDWLQEEELYTAYSNAKVHILPSYFETTGLSSLEAAVMGCNIVVTDKGDTHDYFGDNAWYCEPDDTLSIKKAVDAAYNAPYDYQFRKYILDNYTWQRAAEETLKAYNSVLAKNNAVDEWTEQSK